MMSDEMMDVLMEDVYEKFCVFEESLEIDFDYEFDVAKFFDFLRFETVEEVEESENWFHLAQGHPPSPLLVKLGLVTDEVGGSETSSPKYAYSMTDDGGQSDVLSRGRGKKGPKLLRSKSTNLSRLSKSSRLLQPTASLLAKQNHQIRVRGTRFPARAQKLETPIKTPGDVAATKRQKLEHGYLSKVAQLKHQTCFSHKLPKEVGSSNVNCHAKPKATVPKEPCLETANRAQRYRSRNVAELNRGSKFDSCSVRVQPSSTKISEPKLKRTQSLDPELQGARVQNAKGAAKKGRLLDTKRSNSFNDSMYKESDQMCRPKSRQLTKKILSSKGDGGALRYSKKETTVQKECKRTNSKKDLETLPIELFSQLSLNSENQMHSRDEDEKPLQIKGLKKNVQCFMKENKNANTVIGKSMKSCLKQNEVGGGRTTVMRNQPTSSRSLAIH